MTDQNNLTVGHIELGAATIEPGAVVSVGPFSVGQKIIGVRPACNLYPKIGEVYTVTWAGISKIRRVPVIEIAEAPGIYDAARFRAD